ncbi:MAG: mucoidy inhibitor MuiA family protein [Methylobacteriaceae bacterium]|nr:mucoidy inhibitor MuiA family protein [Methylobacteriaceae bacterium]
MTLVRYAISVGALLAALPALAADLDAPSKIDAVTVYPDAASVTRRAEIDLPAGATTLIFRGLPAALDPASIRVEGMATAALAIGAVETRPTPAETKPDTRLEQQLRTLRGEREIAQVAIDTLEGKKAMMKRYAESGPDKLGDQGKALDIAQWSAAWEAIGAGLAKVHDELRVAQGRARNLDAEIAALEATRLRPTPRAPRRDVAVSLEAGAATTATIALTYRVAGASWRASYEARLDTSGSTTKPKLDVIRRAAVTQRTGEDWSDVELAVSTTRANRGVAAPEVQPMRLAFWEPPALARPAPAARARSDLAAGAAAPQEMAAAPVPAAPPAAKVAQEREATLEAGAFQASFRAPGRMSVPGDGAPKSFRVSTRSLTPDLSVKASPLLDETAYLEARIVNEDEAPLLPGEIAVFRDGAFVGAGRVGLVAPGDSTDLGFGADDRVKVTRVPVRRKENEPTWLGSTKTDTREFRLTVRNLHNFPVRATLVDQIPFSENSAITVEQLPQTTPPTEKQVGDKRGVMAWSWTLQPDEQKEVRLGWRMKWPADREVVFEPAPVQRAR